MKQIFLMVLCLSFLNCNTEINNSEKRKENKKKENRAQCLLLSLLLTRQYLINQGKSKFSEEESIDLMEKNIIFNSACNNYLNQKDRLN